MEGDSGQQTFNLPVVNRPECDEVMSSTPLHNETTTRGISKHCQKPRAKTRSKSRTKASTGRGLRSGMSSGGQHGSAEKMDGDLRDIARKLDAAEERATQLLNKLQGEITMSGNDMLETILNTMTTGADNVRNNMPQVQTVRQANRSVKAQLRVLEQIDHD